MKQQSRLLAPFRQQKSPYPPFGQHYQAGGVKVIRKYIFEIQLKVTAGKYRSIKSLLQHPFSCKPFKQQYGPDPPFKQQSVLLAPFEQQNEPTPPFEQHL